MSTWDQFPWPSCLETQPSILNWNFRRRQYHVWFCLAKLPLNQIWGTWKQEALKETKNPVQQFGPPSLCYSHTIICVHIWLPHLSLTLRGLTMPYLSLCQSWLLVQGLALSDCSTCIREIITNVLAILIRFVPEQSPSHLLGGIKKKSRA